MVKVVQPYAEILNCPDRQAGVQLLRQCESAARLSHRSEDKQTEDSWERLLRAVVLEHGDFSVIEHASVQVFVLCDRGVSHEWVRHRLGAYTQESTRFVNYQKKFGGLEFICPFEGWGQEGLKIAWMQAMDNASGSYSGLLQQGIAPQLARSILPNSLATRLFVTYNLRMWRHFLIMRTTKETHPQMKEITLPLLAKFKERIPLLFDDLEPNVRQAEGMRRLR